MRIYGYLKRFSLVFWDFDGVIKESAEIKGECFVELFRIYGEDNAIRIMEHHNQNAGMSRYEKIPIYLEWYKKQARMEMVEQLCDEYSSLVVDRVLCSEWVPGVKEYLHENPYGQIFVLLTATPQKEIEDILKRLDIYSCFDAVFGAPGAKAAKLAYFMSTKSVGLEEVLYIGDSAQEKKAANVNRVKYLLRRHDSNDFYFNMYNGFYFYNFLEGKIYIK